MLQLDEFQACTVSSPQGYVEIDLEDRRIIKITVRTQDAPIWGTSEIEEEALLALMEAEYRVSKR
jgi:hypothetical protein